MSPDTLNVQLARGGTAQVALPLPNATSLFGQAHHLQVAAIALDAQLQFGELTSTNALTLAFGAF